MPHRAAADRPGQPNGKAPSAPRTQAAARVQHQHPATAIDPHHVALKAIARHIVRAIDQQTRPTRGVPVAPVPMQPRAGRRDRAEPRREQRSATARRHPNARIMQHATALTASARRATIAQQQTPPSRVAQNGQNAPASDRAQR